MLIRRDVHVWFGLFLCASVAGASLAQAAELPEHSSSAASLPADHFLTHFQQIDLIDQAGQAFQPDRLTGRVLLVSFIYTRCASVCSLQTRVLAEVLQALPPDVRDQVRFVSLSLDPAYDRPQQLQQFAATQGADQPGWWFLTGDTAQIQQLTHRLRLFDESTPEQPAQLPLHRTSLWLVDAQGRMLQRYRGDPPDQERLVRELTQVSRMRDAL